jgi:hypothetical protein
MVKKTAKTPKPNLQRAREEQWRRRVAAQGGTTAGTPGAGATLDRTDGTAADSDDGTYVPRAATGGARATAATSSARAGAMPRSRVGSTAAGATQRRMAQPARTGRMRLAANAMSIDEEMHYVRSDIKRLIMLTAICLVVLIALSFVIR